VQVADEVGRRSVLPREQMKAIQKSSADDDRQEIEGSQKIDAAGCRKKAEVAEGADRLSRSAEQQVRCRGPTSPGSCPPVVTGPRQGRRRNPDPRWIITIEGEDASGVPVVP
jgi:hypothetical protein